MQGMDALFNIAFAAWLLLAASWALFRKPGIGLFSPVWKPWSPQDYVTPIGVVLWIIGAGTFLACWIAFFFLAPA